MNTFTRKRPRPGSEIAKSISHSRRNHSRCSGVMSASAVWRTVSGDSTCLLTGKIWPSILILMGAFEVKKRSEAFFSTISLKSGLVLSDGTALPFERGIRAGRRTRPVDSRGLPARGARRIVRVVGRRRFAPLVQMTRPCSSSTMRSAPPSSMFFTSRLLSSLMRRRSSFFESALRSASS